MNDRAIGLLEQYEIEVEQTRKGRGAVLCDTDRGLLIFKEYNGNPERLHMQNALLEMIADDGIVRAESLIPTKEGELCVRDGDGVAYLLKTYRDARECNIREREECLSAAGQLAKLHLCTQKGLPGEETAPFSIAGEYDKRNREMKKIRKFLHGKSQKTWFEIALMGCFDTFFEQGLEAADGWNAYSCAFHETAPEGICHGDFQYHNLLFDADGWYLINFERCIRDDPVRDLHLLLRKLLEKSNWSKSLGADLINAYEKVRPLSAVSRIDLYYRLYYPEKFWKIANFYYNSGKAWIPGRNQEKLEKVLSQERAKRECLEEVFSV